MAATITYGKAPVSPYTTSFPSNSGVFLCSYPISAGGPGGANDANGIYLVYGQTKTVSVVDDSAAVVFIGRKFPIPEMGIFAFRKVHLSYRFPVDTATSGHTFLSMGVDNATDIETCINAMLANQHGYSDLSLSSVATNGPCLVSLQDARTSSVSTTHGRVLQGYLTSVSIDDLQPNWKQFTADFIQTGTT